MMTILAMFAGHCSAGQKASTFSFYCNAEG
jgi:hypothetical protein